ncbi:hypothetical protein [Pararhodobacter sp.]|uniref:hypothetical protein n=1 Tax=Pararhodobacter sp. TaxID=2127056 RepID=UPI002FDDA8D4
MTKKPATARKAPAPALEPEAMRGAIAQIESHAGFNLEALKALLVQGRGAKFTRLKSGVTRVRIFGIAGDSAQGEGAALANWANAARRALLRAGQ